MNLSYILLLSLFVVGVSSLPIQPGKALIVTSRQLSQDPPLFSGFPPPASEARSRNTELQVDLSIPSDLSGTDGENTLRLHNFVLDLAATPINLRTVMPPTNSTTRLISPLIVVSCIILALFLSILVGFSWIVCRYGRNAAKLADDEEHIIGRSINISHDSVELNPAVIEEERLPRAPSSKRFKRYASGRVPLGAGPILPGPPSKHSKRTFRRPSPLRHVYSASSFAYEEPDFPSSPLYPNSVNYSCSDASSSCSVDMPQTPDLDDVAVRRELFNLDDPFACLSPCIPTGPPRNSLKVSMVPAEQDISEAYDSCWIIGEYADTEDEDEDDVGR